MFGMKRRRDEAQHQEAEKINKLRNSVAGWMKEAEYSPDLLHLAKFEFQLVFFMDEFQMNHPKNELINDQSVFLCKAESIQPFTVWKKRLGEESYPIPFKADAYNHEPWRNPKAGYDAGSVRGEIHAVRPLTIIPFLDTVRQNGLHFIRERVKFMVDYKEKSFSLREGWHFSDTKRVFVEAWMYQGIKEVWDEQSMDMLKPVRMFHPNDPANAPYYKFTPLEYNDV